MNPGRIPPSTQMLELMRALASTRGARPAKASLPGKSASANVARTHDLDALRQRLMAMLAGVDPGDAQRVAAVRRPLLQEIILWEFGSDFRQDPEFAPMLDSIEQVFEADPQAPERMKRLIGALRG